MNRRNLFETRRQLFKEIDLLQKVAFFTLNKS